MESTRKRPKKYRNWNLEAKIALAFYNQGQFITRIMSFPSEDKKLQDGQIIWQMYRRIIIEGKGAPASWDQAVFFENRATRPQPVLRRFTKDLGGTIHESKH